MRKLEEKSRKRLQKRNLQKLILSTVKVAGLLSAGLFAPNVLKAMNGLGILSYPRQKESINASRNRLMRRGLLEFKGKSLCLTKRGESVLRRLEAKDFRLKKPKRWDGKWRVLIFDIPEKRKVLRERVREMLTMIGFVRLQDSVWIYPYDCEDLIKLFKADLNVGKGMIYMIVDELEYDTSLKKSFKL
jgi:DNA-binding transcriptional regulator PaaX